MWGAVECKSKGMGASETSLETMLNANERNKG